MSYSRRQLYAMGEPIGDSATRRKADGGLILGDGGGGGGGGGSPVQHQTQVTDVPDWAKGYAQDVLAKGKALTDTPYQAYGGQRISGFTPLQEQAFQGAAQLGPTAQTAQASNLAGAAGLGALGTQYQAGQFSGGRFTPGAAQAYMNPYLQSALNPQIALMQQEQGRQAAQMASQATQAGAFGGSRFGIAQAQQNLNNQLAQQNLIGQGYSQAYQQAQNQFNQDMARRMQAQQLGEQSRQFGANLGMQGLQTGLQAASTLGGLGQQQFAQQQGAIQAQQAAGAAQQAQQQKVLDTAYQDFLTQKNYPYQQLSFMQNLIRGTPMGMNTQSQVYQAPPSTMQTLGALGLGAYGMSKLFAEGGEVKGYADGDVVGDTSVTDKFNDMGYMAAQVARLSDDQLQSILENPTTQAEAAAAQQELNRRQEAMLASERMGLAGAYNKLPYDTQQQMVRAAGGGILAFAGDDDDNDPVTGQMVQSPGNPTLYAQALQQAMDYNKLIGGFKGTTMTPEDEEAYVKRQFALEKGLAGPNQAAEQFRKYLSGAEGDRAAALEQSKGLGALQAASAILQPGGTIRGIGAAGSAFAGEYSKGLQADRAMKRQLAMANFNLADAERKERMGYTKSAMDSLAKRQANLQAADKLRLDVLKSQGATAARVAQAARPIGTGGGQKAAKERFAIETYLPEAQAKFPDLSPELQRAKAFQIYQERQTPGLPGVQARVEATAEDKARERAMKRYTTDPELNTALRKKDSAAATARRQAILREELSKPEPAPGTVKPIPLD